MDCSVVEVAPVLFRGGARPGTGTARKWRSTGHGSTLQIAPTC
jgi:hypothetical protein